MHATDNKHRHPTTRHTPKFNLKPNAQPNPDNEKKNKSGGRDATSIGEGEQTNKI